MEQQAYIITDPNKAAQIELALRAAGFIDDPKFIPSSPTERASSAITFEAGLRFGAGILVIRVQRGQGSLFVAGSADAYRAIGRLLSTTLRLDAPQALSSLLTPRATFEQKQYEQAHQQRQQHDAATRAAQQATHQRAASRRAVAYSCRATDLALVEAWLISVSFQLQSSGLNTSTLITADTTVQLSIGKQGTGVINMEAFGVSNFDAAKRLIESTPGVSLSLRPESAQQGPPAAMRPRRRAR